MAGKVRRDVALPPLSSSQAMRVSPLRALPVNTPTTVSKLLPTVDTVTWVMADGVKRNQTVWLTDVTQLGPGSPFSTVAIVVLCVICAGRPLTSVALAKASFVSGAVVAVAVGDGPVVGVAPHGC